MPLRNADGMSCVSTSLSRSRASFSAGRAEWRRSASLRRSSKASRPRSRTGPKRGARHSPRSLRRQHPPELLRGTSLARWPLLREGSFERSRSSHLPLESPWAAGLSDHSPKPNRRRWNATGSGLNRSSVAALCLPSAHVRPPPADPDGSRSFDTRPGILRRRAAILQHQLKRALALWPGTTVL
jgi:hypothetical protein